MAENRSMPVEVQDFLFKQAAIEQICEEFANIPVTPSLIAADAKRGLLYIGHENKLLVVKPGNDQSHEWKLEIDLRDKAYRVQINCDYTLLAVSFSGALVSIYDLTSISKHTLDLLHQITLSNNAGNVYVKDLKWNPAIPEMLCSVTSDYSVGCFQVSRDRKTGYQIVGLEIPQGVEALCVSWSPKGKQLVVGCKNGDIIQLKPELKAARHLSGIKPSEGVIISILWVSNYQFCVCYYLEDDSRINVMIADAPKGVTTPKFTTYEEMTFGSGPKDNLYYYFEHLPEWGLIIVSSTNSSEVAVLGSADNGATWSMWQMIEGGAVQLPLNKKTKAENYPVGIIVDKSPTQRLPWSNDSTLPIPVPILRILVTSGQLCSYHMVNLKENTPNICSAPTETIQAPAVPRTSIGPEVSFNVPSGATSTPRVNKTTLESQIDKPKMSNMFANAPAPNFSFLPSNNKAAETALQPEMKSLGFSVPPEIKTGGLFTTTSVKTNLFQQENKTPQLNPQFKQALIAQPPTVQPELKSTGFATRPEARNEPPKVQATPPEIRVIKEPPKEQQAPPPYRADDAKPAAKPAAPVYDDALCLRAYYEEQSRFDKELKNKLDMPKWHCGTEEERELLIKKTEEIDEFLRELKDTTNSLASDVACLKSLLLQSFAWVEESKSKNSAASFGSRGQADDTKLADLKRLYYYTQSQLVQATKVLDLEWSEYKNRELSRMKIPSLEVIYQSLIKYNQIIAQERKNIDELMKKWRSLARGGSSSVASLDRSMASLNLSQSTSSTLVSEAAIELRCKLIANNARNFTREKQTRLRDLLAETAPMIVRAAKPSAVQDRLEATLSALASQKATEALTPKTRTPKSASTEQQRMAAAQQKTPEASKPKSQNPLSSLDNLVSGFGSGLPSLSKSTSSAAPFAALAAKPQLVPAQSKAKENVSTSFNQSSQQLQNNLNIKPLAKMDNISFGTLQPPKTPEAQIMKPLDTSNFTMFPPNTFGRLGSPEALASGSAVAIIPSVSTLPSVPKSTFSFSSSTAPPIPQNFVPAPSLDNSTVFKFSPTKPSTPPDESPTSASGLLDLSSFGSRSAVTITPISGAKAAASTAPVTPVSFTFGKTSSLQQQTPIFGQTTTTSTSQSATPSLLGKSTSPSVTITPLSAAPKSSTTTTPASQSATTSASAPASTATSSTSAFGTSSLFGGLATASSTFNFTPTASQAAAAAPTTSTPATPSSVISFGNMSSTAPSSTAGFAGMLSATSALSFGTPATGAPITPAFGKTTTPSANIFGSTAPTSATTTTAAATSTPSGTSIFGNSNSTAPASTATNIFGGATAVATTATTTIKPLFANAPPAGSTVFGSTAAVSSSSGVSSSTENSFFSVKPTVTATATTTSTTSIFGGSSTTTPNATIFGNSTSSAPVFGAPSATTQASSIFGGSSTTQSSTSIFGSSTATPSAGSIFGGANTTKAFGAAAATPATTTTSSSSIFGSSTPAAGSIFGGGANAASPAGGTSVFGASTAPAASIFGGAAAAATTTASSSIFGTAAATTAASGSIFGAAAASPQAATGSIFGAAAASPTATGTGSIFGGAATLGTATTPFGGTPSPAGGMGAAPAFGGAAAFGSAPAFGSNPVFGSPAGGSTFGSGFGSPPAFGGTPAPGFGSAPVFGSTSPGAPSTSPNKVFGSSTFEALGAQTGGLSFGSLAQNTDAQKPAFGGSSSFSSWR